MAERRGRAAAEEAAAGSSSSDSSEAESSSSSSSSSGSGSGGDGGSEMGDDGEMHEHEEDLDDASGAKDGQVTASAKGEEEGGIGPGREVGASIALAMQQLRGNGAEQRRSVKEAREQLRRKERESRKRKRGADAGKIEFADSRKLCEEWGVGAEMAEALRERFGITTFFPWQARAIATFMQSETNDICISAPTGSGKTLIFAIPVVAALRSRVVRRLRALILLPTRELAKQCKTVMEVLAAHTDLSVVLAIGQTSVEKDQRAVTDCDILVATPGRLIDLLKLTSSLTLEHLSFLVVDEADRLLSDRYQGWLENILGAAYQDTPGKFGWRDSTEQELVLKSTTRRKLTGSSLSSHRFDEPALRKVLCSATLTRNPQKLAALHLRRPLHINLEEDLRQARKLQQQQQDGTQDGEESAKDNALEAVRPISFMLPDTLEQFMMVCPKTLKPHALFQLVKSFGDEPTLIFAASVEATHRLTLFLENLLGPHVAELSSSQSQGQRSKVLKHLAKGSVRVLVVSDVMARGVDMPNLVNIVNYDVPSYVKGYVHRVGRVARAGRTGRAFTLLRSDQVSRFRRMTRDLQSRIPVTRKSFDKEAAVAASEQMQTALAKMKTTVKDEARKKRRFH